MSVLNLGLQCVGLAREKMPEEFSSQWNSLNELRKIAERNVEIVGAVTIGSNCPGISGTVPDF